ncbi:MAG: undecaprenyl-diphosphate phosphatase [Chroococcidiopsidaceae cyanobacterium CP_BM_ER_R8_30]|nr:undecaprenyl-diphosphate phosphatase [Chroococcidiopsidaceae cyanobacterium CP_BM_ER_R8_30]
MMVSLLLTTPTHPSDVDFGFVQLGWFKVIVLGIVQGITELLPISSTAHLRVVPALLGWQDPGSAFSAAMQLASLIAVITYFWQDIKELVGGTVRAVARRNYQSEPFRIVVGIVVGTIPICISGLLLKKLLNMPDSPLRRLEVVGIACIVMSLLLALAEMQGKHNRRFNQLTLWDGLLVGVAQAFAPIPGVSRSGSTITAAISLKMERETAARFSFLLGIPAVLLAGAVELHALFQAHLNAEGWLILLVGLISGSISAFFAIFLLLRYLEKQSTWVFVWYRLGLGIFLLVSLKTGFLHN